MSDKTFLLIDNKWLVSSEDVNRVDSMLSVQEFTNKSDVPSGVLDISDDNITADSYRAAQEISNYASSGGAIELSWSGLERVAKHDRYAHRKGVPQAVRDHNRQIESYSWTRK